MALFIARGNGIKAFQATKNRLNKISSLYKYYSARDSDALKVETLHSTYVRPHKLLGRKDIQLVSFDLLGLGLKYIQRLMVYRTGNAGGDKFDEVEEKLKDGLRVVLEDFYPLAGKIGKDEEGILRIEYDDDMDGAEVKIGIAEEVEVADMVEGNRVTKFNEFFPYNGVSGYEGLYRSLLAVQLTKLKDGFALGCALNHAVVDGTSTWHFLKAWAEICSGSAPISVIKPFHDRTKARNTRVKINLPLNSQDPEFALVLDSPILSQRLFSFSEPTVNHIKSNANKSQTSVKPFSTFQCLAVHVWQAITRARQLGPEDMTILVVFANSRTRIDPQMPENYFGNLFTLPITATTAKVLFTCPPEIPASMIQQAIEMHDSNVIHGHVKEWEKNPYLPKFSDLGSNTVVFGSSPKFKVYELDFGWGKPEIARSGSNNRYDGMVYLHQGKNGERSIDVDVSLEENTMNRLEMDKEFLMMKE